MNKRQLLLVSGAFVAMLGSFCLPAGSAHASATIESAPVSGLTAYWTFDGKYINWGTNTAFDSSGNGNNGTLTNMTSAANTAKGKLGQALTFDGNIDSILLSSNPISSLASPSSVCAWANTADVNSFAGGWSETILNLFTDSNNGVRVGSIVSTGQLFVSYRTGGTFHRAESVGTVFTDNTWNYVCYVWDGSGMTLYGNGNSLATTTNAEVIGGNNVIGALDNAGDGTWDGTLDDVRIYKRALSAAEVRRLYQGGVVTLNKVPAGKATQDVVSATFLNSGLVGYWSFDGKTVDWTHGLAKDTSGHGNNGQLFNMSTTSSPVMGKIGQALSFDGASQYADMGNTLNMSTDDWTESIWFRTTNSTIFSGIMGKSKATAQAGRYSMFINDTPGNVECFINYSGTDIEVQGGNFMDGKWHLVTCTWDRSGNMTVYVDGAAKASTDISGGTGVNMSTADSFFVGAYQDGTNPDAPFAGSYFAGSLDDARVYNRSLSAAEVIQLYRSGR